MKAYGGFFIISLLLLFIELQLDISPVGNFLKYISRICALSL